ncbi:Protein kinase-like domain protein [Niveomyces insectorum RCEF 264]|uniref:EKC/KEOPS complex subunit BUD32 n=1 Tax=Niveomyces insectorum RCEF 264 TaxID=1081102 RepID=A0A167TFJ5_9HYPO|nr:Protein kinase-like domain protein [Niveomyces insectorum RCEF 264]
MGSNFFSTCEPDVRLKALMTIPYGNGMMWVVQDWDQRRTIRVHAPTRAGRDFDFETFAKYVDDLPADTMLVTVADDFSMVSSSSDFTEDGTQVPVYPSLAADFPPAAAATVRRRDLVEVDRLGVMVDLVTYQPSPAQASKRAAFKYFINVGNRVNFWHEMNCMLRMPPHPNIVPMEALVLETVDGDDKVVGFLTRYIPGETLHQNKDRVFKLKYLEQLLDAVDFLNLRCGIVHGDICPWNLLIDAETDSLQLFDFNSGAKLGWEGDDETWFCYEEDRNDVKFVVFTLYEIITRAYEFSFRGEFYPHELDAATVLKKRTWRKHADTQLDHPVTVYRRVLAAWLAKRKGTDRTVRHFSQAAEPLDWPPVPGGPTYTERGGMNDWAGQYRAGLVMAGKDVVRWERPATRALPLADGQRLLATGEVVPDPTA